jgi:hypothetical protein
MLSSVTFQALPGLTGRNWKSPFSSDASESVTPRFRQEIADTLDLGFQSLRTSRRKSLHLYPFKVADLGCCAGALRPCSTPSFSHQTFCRPGRCSCTEGPHSIFRRNRYDQPQLVWQFRRRLDPQWHPCRLHPPDPAIQLIPRSRRATGSWSNRRPLFPTGKRRQPHTECNT